MIQKKSDMALYDYNKDHDGGVLTIWELTETVSELAHLVDIPETALKAIKSEKRKKEYLAVRALLHEVFGATLFLDHHPNGQPFLHSHNDSISISHTHRFVAVLTHPQKRVGVDIECLERNFSAVEHKALSDKEISFLSSEQHPLHLAILWSAKEALYKCISQEGVDFAQQMQIEPFVPQKSGTLYARFYHKHQKNSNHYFLNYKIIDNHILVYVFA